jgi:tetratricopeptide (TPR) repeat protein
MSHSIQDCRRPAGFWLGLGASALLALVCLTAMPPAARSAEKQEISRAIAKEMSAAQKAMQAGQWSEVIKNLEAAETKSGLTAYDKTKINDFKGYSYIKLNNFKAAESAYEAAIAAGGYTAEETAKTTRMLFQLAAQNQQNAKAIEYGKTATESGAATPNDFLIMSQLYYLQKDCKNAVAWGDKALAQFHKAGETPKEVLFQIKLQCASDAGDSAATIAALYDLVRLTNQTKYWNNLIRMERQDERDDANTLMIYRVMHDTNSMNADTDYIEMAQLLQDKGLPGEAQMVLEKAISSGVLKDEHKERTTRLLNSLKTRADADKKGLPQLDAEAQKNPAGQLDVKLGEVYFGAGDYQNAVTAINRGIQKGQVKQLDEAYVYLGRSYAALKNYPEAKKAFGQLKTVPKISPRVLKLWEAYSEKLGTAQT